MRSPVNRIPCRIEEVWKMAKKRKRYEDLDQMLKDLLLNAGAIDVGIVTTESLEALRRSVKAYALGPGPGSGFF